MRPPMTATKNDGVPPLHRKTQLNQKEVLAENHRNLSQQQQQQQQHQTQHEIAQTSSLTNSESDDFLFSKTNSHHQLQLQHNQQSKKDNQFNEFQPISPSEPFRSSAIFSDTSSVINGEDFTIFSRFNNDADDDGDDYDHYNINRQRNGSKLKRVASDVGDSARKILNHTTFNLNNFSDSNSLISINTNNKKKIASSYNLGEVPKNLFINELERFHFNQQQQQQQQQQKQEQQPEQPKQQTQREEQEQQHKDTNYKKKESIGSTSTVLTGLPLSETEPLLLTNIETTIADPKRSICLNKNSASLIFTKKDIPTNSCSSSSSSCCSSSTSSCYNSSSFVNRRSNEYLNTNINLNTTNNFYNNRNNITTTTAAAGAVPPAGAKKRQSFSSQRSYSNEEPLLFNHRRSLQLNYSTISEYSIVQQGRSSTAANNRKQQAYSWYAPVYSALEEEFEQDSRDSSPIHNLANAQKKIQKDNETLETSLLLERNQTTIQPQLHQTRIRRPGVCPSTVNQTGSVGQNPQIQQNEAEGPHATSLLGGPLPRRKRFENFLKSLVGRKSSSREPNSSPLIPSADTNRVSHSPSDHSLLREHSVPGDKITQSTTSLNSVQHKLWNVVPLLRREGSCTSLLHEKSNSLVQYTGLRKCETVLALSRSPTGIEPIKPLNRLRNSISTSNATCSRCSSLLSLAASGSRYSLNLGNSGFITVNGVSDSVACGGPGGGGHVAHKPRPSSDSTENSFTDSAAIITATPVDLFTCKLCLADVKTSTATTIGQCGCIFCTECMRAYIEFEISEGAYEISCPDAQCPSQGIISLAEIAALSTANLMKKHHRYRLNREIELDKSRTWCPRAGCETICMVGTTPSPSSLSPDRVNSITQVLCAVQCPTCKEEFCSGCKKPWHPNITCEENTRRLAADGQDDLIGIPFDNDLIKCCPMCAVPIEKDEGCAQMMCKRCKHVFCWYCLASLDDDFLLRHYDKGPCKNKLGHSRASVVWHRAQVIGIFAGFGILLLVASPLLLLAAPCIICCKCRICNGAAKLDDADIDFDEAVALQRAYAIRHNNITTIQDLGTTTTGALRFLSTHIVGSAIRNR